MAPLKALPSTPEDDHAFETDGIKRNTKLDSSHSRNIVSEEKTHFGHIANGHVQQRSNLSGNFEAPVQEERDDDFAPTYEVDSLRVALSSPRLQAHPDFG